MSKNFAHWKCEIKIKKKNYKISSHITCHLFESANIVNIYIQIFSKYIARVERQSDLCLSKKSYLGYAILIIHSLAHWQIRKKNNNILQ